MKFFKKEKDRHDSAIADFEQVKKTYSEFMALKAPVEYWMEKSKQHRAASNAYRENLISYAKSFLP